MYVCMCLLIHIYLQHLVAHIYSMKYAISSKKLPKRIKPMQHTCFD